MREMFRLQSLRVVALSLLLLQVCSHAWGASRAWLLDKDGKVAKVDLIQHRVTEFTDLPLMRLVVEEATVDPVRGNLFIPTDRGPYTIEVFDLKTLQRKGRLDFNPDLDPLGRSIVRFLVPPTGTEFYVRWWNPAAAGGNGQFEVAVVDARTFKTIARRSTSPPLKDRLLLDAAGRQLYSMSTRERPARIEVFEVPSFSLISAIDLERFLNPLAFGRSIDDFGQGKLLIDENEKTERSQPDRYTLFVFDIATRQPGPKMRTGLEGNGQLLPRTNRMLFDEVIPPKAPSPGRRLGPPITPGRVHVYDTTTGNRLATIQIPVQTMGWYVGVNPTEDTLYYLTDRTTGKESTELILAVVSLTSYSLLKEMAIPTDVPRIFFFDE